MLRYLKHTVRDRLPYSLLLPLYYGWVRRIYRPLHDRAHRRAGFRRLEEFDLATIKGSDVLFVLGSGASINQITAERWTVISSHDSVGFNFWPIHPFVPKMYFFESNPADFYPEHDRRMLKVLADRAADYERTLKVVMDIANPAHQYIFDLPEDFRHSTHSAETVLLVARNRKELGQGIRRLVERGEFERSDHLGALLKITGTLSTMITLGVRMGYRRIVLCGIDLTRAEYFYQDPVLYPGTAQFEYMPRTGKHMTLTRYAWGTMPIDEVVAELKQQVLDPAGIELYVENRSSALWPGIPEVPGALLEPAGAGKAGS